MKSGWFLDDATIWDDLPWIFDDFHWFSGWCSMMFHDFLWFSLIVYSLSDDFPWFFMTFMAFSCLISGVAAPPGDRAHNMAVSGACDCCSNWAACGGGSSEESWWKSWVCSWVSIMVFLFWAFFMRNGNGEEGFLKCWVGQFLGYGGFHKWKWD